MTQFCSLPWTGLDIGPQGGFRPCCKYQHTIADNLTDYTNSHHLRDLRQQFLLNQTPSGCQRCWDDEAAGLPSKRQLDLKYSFNGQHPDLSELKLLSISFGNTCNLACVTCNSASSSRWSQDEKKIDIKQFDKELFHHNQYYKDETFIKQLTSRCDNLIHLDIPGGEPFFANKDIHKNFLKSLSCPEKIKIHYTTNATIFPDNEFWEIWKNFRHVDIQLSIDGIGKQFEYIRYPALWYEVEQNIKKYQEQPNIQLSISHTLSWLNILYLENFLSWCDQQQLPTPYIGPVSRPDFLSTRCLPIYVKQQITNKLKKSNRPEIQQALNYMNLDDQSSLFKKGQEWITTLDQLRNLDFSKVFSEIDEFIQNR